MNYDDTIIIDNGTGSLKIGLGSDEVPRAIVPCLVGEPRLERIQGLSPEESYVGERAQKYRGMLKLCKPLEHGIVVEWDSMKKLWSHAFYDILKVEPKESAVFLTEAPRNPKVNREKMIQIMFEDFCVGGAYVAIQACLALFAMGNTSGMVVDSGDGVSHSVPVHEGYAIQHAIGRINMAGRNLTEYMRQLLTERGVSLRTSAEFEIVRDIKETLAYVAENVDEESKKSLDPRQYTLPDGNIIECGDVRYLCPELLFNPQLFLTDSVSFQEVISTSIQKCAIDTRQELYQNIALSGGNTMFPGIEVRLKKELSKLLPAKAKLDILARSDRKNMVFVGASAMSRLSTFQSLIISAAEYDEYGPGIVHKKCI